MSSKLKDFITKIRACKTQEEEKQLISKEKSDIRQSFQKNQNSLKPRNLVKLLFINLQGHNTEFGQMESLNVTCRNSFIEKKIGYLTMSIFLHEKSEMLMMATNRISLDLDHKNPYIKALALTTFSVIMDNEMAQSISPKIKKIILEDPGYSLRSNKLYYDDPFKASLCRKKALLAATRMLKKCPELAVDYVDIFDKILKEENHGVFLSSLPLIEVVMDLTDTTATFKKLSRLIPVLINKGKSLLGFVDPEYAINSINDPILIISIVSLLRKMFVKARNKGYKITDTYIIEVKKYIIYCISIIRPNKKTANSVLYELAKLALIFKDSNEHTSCGFHILNQLLETKDSNPNFKFVSLNLLRTFENYSTSALEMLSTHCELILNILEDEKEDNSLKSLALTVLPMITANNSVSSILEQLKSLLVQKNIEFERKKPSTEQISFYNQIIKSTFYILEHKMAELKEARVNESINLLLIVNEEVGEENLSSLIQLVNNNPELQYNILSKIWNYLQGNYKQDSFFKLAVYLLGEYGDVLTELGLGFTINEILNLYLTFFKNITKKENKIYFLNSVVKLITKGLSNSQKAADHYLSMLSYFLSDDDIQVQNRATEYFAILSCSDLTSQQLKEIFSSIPAYQPKKQTTIPMKKKSIDSNDFLDLKAGPNLKVPVVSSIYDFKKNIYEDDEVELYLEYNYTNFMADGILTAKNKTAVEMYKVTSQLTGITTPSLDFNNKQIDILRCKKSSSWGFKLIMPQHNNGKCKVKYFLRYFYSKNDFSDKHRINKEGVFDFEVNENTTTSNNKNAGGGDGLLDLDFDFGGGGNVQKETNGFVQKENTGGDLDFDFGEKQPEKKKEKDAFDFDFI